MRAGGPAHVLRAPLAEPSLRGKAAACIGAGMFTNQLIKCAVLLVAATLATIGPAHSTPSAGTLKTLPQGIYQCALPGDAAGAAWRPVAGMDFTIINASSYESERGHGTYLLKGNQLVFTRGPLKGVQLQRSGEYTLRAMEQDASLGAMRCVRLGSSV